MPREVILRLNDVSGFKELYFYGEMLWSGGRKYKLRPTFEIVVDTLGSDVDRVGNVLEDERRNKQVTTCSCDQCYIR